MTQSALFASLFSDGVSLSEVSGFDKDAGPEKKHGPGWCAYHKVNHKPSTKCPYKDKPVHDLSSGPAEEGKDPHSKEELAKHVPEHALDAVHKLVNTFKKEYELTFASASKLLQGGGLSQEQASKILGTLISKGVLDYPGWGQPLTLKAPYEPLPPDEKAPAEPSGGEEAPMPATEPEKPVETQPEPPAGPQHPTAIDEIPLPASLGLTDYEKQQTYKTLSWIASKFSVTPSALATVLGKAGVPASKIPSVESYLKSNGIIVKTPGGKIGVNALDKIDLGAGGPDAKKVLQDEGPAIGGEPKPEGAPGTVANALQAVGLKAWQEPAKALAFLEKSGGFHSVSEVISKANLKLPVAWAHLGLPKMVAARFEQLVSLGYLDKSPDGKYAWKGKGTQVSAPPTPAPSAPSPAPSPPVANPAQKALDTISSLAGLDGIPLTDKQVQAGMKSLATSLSPHAIMYGIPKSVLVAEVGKSILEAGPGGAGAVWPGDIGEFGTQVCDALEKAGLLKVKGLNYTLPLGVTGKAIGELANAPPPPEPEPTEPEPPTPPAPTPEPPVAPPPAAGGQVGGKALASKLLGKLPEVFGVAKAYVAKKLGDLFKKGSESLPEDVVLSTLKKAMEQAGSHDPAGSANAALEVLSEKSLLVKTPTGDYSPSPELASAEPEKPPTPDAKATGKCPDGHATYKSPLPHNCPSCGKVMQPTAGANPADVEAAKKKVNVLEGFKDELGEALTLTSPQITGELVSQGLGGAAAKELFHAMVAGGAITKIGVSYYVNPAGLQSFIDEAKLAATPVAEPVAPVVPEPTSEPPSGFVEPAVVPGTSIKKSQISELATEIQAMCDANYGSVGMAIFTSSLAHKFGLSKEDATKFVQYLADKDLLETTDGKFFTAAPDFDEHLVALISAPTPAATTAPVVPAPTPAIGGLDFPKLLSKMPDELGVAKDAVAKKLQELFPTGDEKLDLSDIYKGIKKSLLDAGSDLFAGTVFDKLEDIGILSSTPGSGGAEYVLSGDLKATGTPTPAVAPPAPPPLAQPPAPVVAPVEDVPTDDEVGEKLGWNSKGKGMLLLKALNSAGANGLTVEEALEKLPADKKPSLGVAKHMLDEALEAGFLKRVPGSKPPKWLFTKKPPAAPVPEPGTTPVAPSEAPATSPVGGKSQVLGIPTSVPDPSELTDVGSADDLPGVNKGKRYLQDKAGNKYLFKPVTEADAFRAHAGQAYASIANKILGPDSTVPVRMVTMPDGKMGSVQPMLPTKDTAASLPVESMNASQKKDLLQSRVMDWLMGNHDTKPANFAMLPGGKLVGVDKEQSFKTFGKDSLNPDYTHTPGGSAQIYAPLLNGFSSGAVDLNLNDALPAIEKVEALPDDEYVAAIKPYVESLAKKTGATPEQQQAQLDQMLARKKNVRKDFEQLFSQLQAKKGIAEPFSFDKSKVSPEVPPGAHVPAPTSPSPATTGPTLAPGPKKLADALSGAGLSFPGGSKLSPDQTHALAGALSSAFAKHGDPSGAVMMAEIKNAVGGSLAEQQAVLQGMVDKGLVTKKVDGHYVVKADFLSGADPMAKPEEPTGTCPSGHKTYQSPTPHNCPSCGKVMQPSTDAGGTTESAQKAAVVAKIPKSSADFPDPAKLQTVVADASAVGGKKDKSILKDPSTGVEYMFKPDAGETGWRAEMSSAYADIASQLAGPDSVVPVKVVNIPGQGKGSIQPWRPDAVGDLSNVDVKKLSGSQKKDLQQERVLDWLMSSHDSKGDNFIMLDSGKILGVDKEQAFRFIGKDKLDVSYKPNLGGDPVYNKLYGGYASGALDLDLNEIEPLISKIESMPDAEYMARLEPLLGKAAAQHIEWGGNAAWAKQKILERKQNIRQDFEQFFTKLQNQRGVPGPFKFKGASAAPEAPATPAPGPTTPATLATPPEVTPGPATTSLASSKVPPLSSLQKVEGKAPVGGTKAKAYYQQPGSDQLYIYKPAPKKFRAAVQQAAGDLASMITDPGDTVPVKMVDENGQLGSLQPEMPVQGNLANFDLTKLSPSQYSDLMRERVVDWVLGNHDSHDKNMVVTPEGKILGVDKEQAFKHIGEDQLSDNYAPNAAYGEKDPVYNDLFQLYKSGNVNLNLNDAAKTIARVEAVPDNVWMQSVEPYLSELAKEKGPAIADAKRAAILARKQNVRKDFEQFFTKLQNAKGIQGPFQFGVGEGEGEKLCDTYH